MDSSSDLVLVTGGSGFLGAHCILALLKKGYRVRATVRNLSRSDAVRTMLLTGGATQTQVDTVEFSAADLLSNEGWPKACENCTYVLHVASPFPPGAPKHEDDLIIPAREGTLRALRAAKAAGTVKRVVVTSSFAAIGYGHAVQAEPFTEKDWTVAEGAAPYQKSKTLAERAAWEFMANEKGDESKMELAVINPVGIYGPVLSTDYAASIELVTKLMKGQIPGVPRLTFGVVDVRDVAELHVLAMASPKAAGERFLALTDEGFITPNEIALKLKKQLGPRASKVPTREIPDWLLRAVGWFDATVALVTPELGRPKNATNAKAKEMLGWQPRTAEEALMATAESLFDVGVL